MSKASNPNIEKIESMQVEKVVGGSIHLKLGFFKCVECGASSMRRTVSAYTIKSYKSDANPKFDCQQCQHKSKFVYSAKHETCVDFEEYREILKEEI